MKRTYLVVGHSSGIGLALTRRALEEGHSVVGVSRRASGIAMPGLSVRRLHTRCLLAACTPRSCRRSISNAAQPIRDTMSSQLTLFDGGAALPGGFRYAPDVLPVEAESELLDCMRELPFKEFDFHGYRGKRRVVSYGWRYDFDAEALHRVDDMPPFLRALRGTAASFAGMEASELQQALVTEYSAGAGIGWHRDKGVFGQIVRISLLGPCVFRLRRRSGATWERASIIAQPRSAYLLSGASRTEWEHSVPPVQSMRYSVTFRNLRGG